MPVIKSYRTKYTNKHGEHFVKYLMPDTGLEMPEGMQVEEQREWLAQNAIPASASAVYDGPVTSGPKPLYEI